MNFNNSLELTQSQTNNNYAVKTIFKYIKYEQVRIRGRNQKRI